MGFREVADLSADVTVSLGGVNKKTGKKNPTQIEGYFLGSKTVDDAKKKSGKSFIYIFQTPKGNVGVWGKTDMDRKMGAITPGVMVRVTHTGMQATKNGDMYKYSVAIDDSNTIEVVGAAPSQASDSGEEAYEPEGFDSEDSFDDADAYTPARANAEEASQNASLSAAERKAKVAALLAGKGKR